MAKRPLIAISNSNELLFMYILLEWGFREIASKETFMTKQSFAMHLMIHGETRAQRKNEGIELYILI